MRMRGSLLAVTLMLVVGLAGAARADINFTASFDGATCNADPNTLGYPAITFTNAIVLTNSVADCLAAEFPPHSGDGVVYDFPGTPMTISFAELEGTENGDGDTVSGYFTTASDITFNAFDEGGALCDTVFFQGPNYLGSGGPPPNQFLSVHCSEIASVMIFSSTGPNSFTLDDLTYPISDTAVVPEPASMILLGTGVFAILKKKLR